jgi:hypothetical protein
MFVKGRVADDLPFEPGNYLNTKFLRDMKQSKKYNGNSIFSNLGSSFQQFLSSNLKNVGLFQALSRQLVPSGGNWVETEHQFNVTSHYNEEKAEDMDTECTENRYSVLYLRNDQYHHVGCASQAEAQLVMGQMMTDEIRIPKGIYDAETDSFEWEIIGQYFHSQDPIEEQQERLEQILNISRALRRRDSSWEPGYLQRPSFFA